jgi:alginate O-acetyltransferase complex protein AlgJ
MEADPTQPPLHRPEAPRSGLEGRFSTRGTRVALWSILRDARLRLAPQDEGAGSRGRLKSPIWLGMLKSHRRYFAIAAFLLLATPLALGVVRPDPPAAILKEGRYLAPAPTIPAASDDWLTLSARIDAFLGDHFGLRQVLIRAHKDLTKPLLGFGNDSVLIGRDGRLFYLGQEAVQQSAGLIVRDHRVSDTADLLARMNAALKARGVGFLVAVPPNAATIYADDLPNWAQNRGRRTEYDLMLDELAAHGVRAVDLRPALKAARSGGPVFYMHDSHWTARGALAAFNAVAEADGRTDWRLDPGSALGPPQAREGGDLARMLGEDATETVEDLTLPAARTQLLTADPVSDFVGTLDRPGPTIMVFGDSFTQDYFARMLMQRAGRVVWLEYRKCGFDWKSIDRFHPDEVWWMPNERFLICDPGVRPVDFTG